MSSTIELNDTMVQLLMLHIRIVFIYICELIFFNGFLCPKIALVNIKREIVGNNKKNHF